MRSGIEFEIEVEFEARDKMTHSLRYAIAFTAIA
jgi:hypothetical protein